MPKAATPARCANCSGQFGLKRYDRHRKQFCSQRCITEYERKSRQAPPVHSVSNGPFSMLRRVFGASATSQL
jgi:hypothetical protein